MNSVLLVRCAKLLKDRQGNLVTGLNFKRLAGTLLLKGNLNILNSKDRSITRRLISFSWTISKKIALFLLFNLNLNVKETILRDVNLNSISQRVNLIEKERL